MDQTETPATGEAPIMRPLGAGDPAPTFVLPDPDDVMISSAELPASQARQDRAQGRRLTGVYMEEAHV